MAEWRCVPVVHCKDAWGLVLRLAGGFTLVASGDTRPCRRLVQAGRGATLLLHEATFEDALFSLVRCHSLAPAAPHFLGVKGEVKR